MLQSHEGSRAGVETWAATLQLQYEFYFLLYQLQEPNINPVLINWISAALHYREVVLRCYTWTVAPGLPWSSPLSPVFFSVCTVWITEEQFDGRGWSLSYADDILVYRQGKDRVTVVQELQEKLDHISTWCSTSKALTNSAKNTVTWFSPNSHLADKSVPMGLLWGCYQENWYKNIWK